MNDGKAAKLPSFFARSFFVDFRLNVGFRLFALRQKERNKQPLRRSKTHEHLIRLPPRGREYHPGKEVPSLPAY